MDNPNKAEAIRPTKKQRQLLGFIADFINQHGYSPSYREIMQGLNYNSVATVSLHVNSLIKRGQLKKRDHSARSLEVVDRPSLAQLSTNEVRPDQEKWLVEKVEHAFAQLEQGTLILSTDMDNLYVLVGALKILGLDGAAVSFTPRLAKLKQNASAQPQ